MTDFPLEARVECTDGYAGQSTHIIVNPIDRQVTHFVVQNQQFEKAPDRLVPVDKVKETTSELIRLNLTLAERAKLAPFTETHFVTNEYPDYSHRSVQQMPYVTPTKSVEIPVTDELVPPGEMAIRRGAKVEATDGYVGKVTEFMVEPDSGHVSHLVVRERHLWGKQDLTLPLSAIDRVLEDTIYLKLDKAAVKMLPAIPVKRHYRGKSIELVASIFDQMDKADEALEYMTDMKKRGYLKIRNAAVLVKDEAGQFSFKEAADVEAKSGRVFGAITGGLIGLLGGPVGVMVGAAAGAGTGGLAASKIDMGFSDEYLQKFAAGLQPGSSALILLIEHQWVQQASESLANLKGIMLQETLTNEMVNQLLAEVDAEESEEAS